MTMYARRQATTGNTQSVKSAIPMRLLRALALKRRLENRDEEVPLCVGLDGTLIRGRITHEAVLALLRTRPGLLLKLLPVACCQPARFKARLCEMASLDPALLPFRRETLRFLYAHHARGRVLVLVGTADREMVRAVADHLGIFAQSFGSNRQCNLTPAVQARLLCTLFGPGGFDYVGTQQRDIPAWATARRAVIVSPEPHLLEHSQWNNQTANILAVDAIRSHAWLDVLRPSYWPRNLLVFLPLLALDVFSAERLVLVYCAACASGLVTAASDIVADMVHRPEMRRHSLGRRGMASGHLALDHALVLAGFLAALGFLVALFISPAFAAWLALYPVLAMVYALRLKHIAGADIFSLAALDLHRLLAGGIVIGAGPFFWQLAFAAPFFLGLAARHRHAALQCWSPSKMEQMECRQLPALGIAAGYVSVLVLALYAHSGDPARALGAPVMIWALCPVLLYWETATWITRERGWLHAPGASAFLSVKQGAAAVVAALIFATGFLFPG